MNKRQAAKAATKAKAIEAARDAFSGISYHTVTVRELAGMMGMSTGAIFSCFDSKADLWSASMLLPVPADTALTRAAPMLLDALRDANGCTEGEGYASYQNIIDLAEAPLDGEVWRRHLAAKACADPTSRMAESAPVVPPAGALAQ